MSSGHTKADAAGALSARALWALGFVVLALAALVAVPAYYGARVAAVQDRLANVLEPAARNSSQLRLIKARQMARVERFLATEDRGLRLEYVAALSEEDEVLARLRVLADQLDRIGEMSAESDVARPPRGELDTELFERVALLASESAGWRFQNQQVFETVLQGDPLPPGTRERIVRGYEELQRLAQELDDAIQAHADAGRREMAAELRQEARLTFALGLVAFLATLIVARIAARYRSLTIEREQRRREAVRARREVDALLEATGDGVLGIDLDGKCISLNRVGAELVGYSEREIMGRDVHATLFHTTAGGVPAVREESEILAAISEGRGLESPEGALMWHRRGGSFPARWSLRPMIDGRELRGAVLTFTDMTEAHEREEALRRAIRQREDVVSIVSHDLRNPLGVTLGAAELLLELPLDEKQRERQAAIIHRSGVRMKQLIDDLLDVSRIEEGALMVRPSREDLQEILEEAVELFAIQAEDAGIRLEIRAPAGEPVARVDRDRILQALSNLVDNAIRLTDEGGRVTLWAAEEGDEVLLGVDDSGPGIAPDLIETLFDRFAQSEGSDRGAAGLGLTIVRGVAVAHGGEVGVTTELGRGSEFVIRLPKDGPPRQTMGG